MIEAAGKECSRKGAFEVEGSGIAGHKLNVLCQLG
jgi:hypothetical protein